MTPAERELMIAIARGLEAMLRDQGKFSYANDLAYAVARLRDHHVEATGPSQGDRTVSKTMLMKLVEMYVVAGPAEVAAWAQLRHPSDRARGAIVLREIATILEKGTV